MAIGNVILGKRETYTLTGLRRLSASDVRLVRDDPQLHPALCLHTKQEILDYLELHRPDLLADGGGR